MSKERILIVEDELSINNILVMVLEGEGYSVTSANNGQEGIDQLKKEIFDIVITDIRMPEHDGFEVLKTAMELAPETLVVMITAFGTTEDAVEAMKMGAYDYINKPFKIDEIRLIVQSALERSRLRREVSSLRNYIEDRFRLNNIVGKCKVMRDILASLPRIAQSTASVLILGESGCGKELFAHAIHNMSRRVGSSFLAINCAALPEGLLESELFGHMKGAFTGATVNKEGLFEVANNGTIFLDEIGDMPFTLQAKLLRVLEDGLFRRIGGTTDIKVDVRIISATNKDLKAEMAAGRFRNDLFYRLNVIPLNIPPLRERREDIPEIIDFYLERHNIKDRKFTIEAVSALMNHTWEGNVRELENTIERVLTFSENRYIDVSDLPAEIIKDKKPLIPTQSHRDSVYLGDEGIDLDRLLEGIEKGYLMKSLDMTDGNKTNAAELLKISFRQFRHRLKKYNID